MFYRFRNQAKLILSKIPLVSVCQNSDDLISKNILLAVEPWGMRM